MSKDSKREEAECPKCHGGKMVWDAGLVLIEMMMGKEKREERIYPCAVCCPELSSAVSKEYKKFLDTIEEMKKTIKQKTGEVCSLKNRISRAETELHGR